MVRFRSIDDDGMPIVGFCHWCNANFYSRTELDLHLRNMATLCAPFREYTKNANQN